MGQYPHCFAYLVLSMCSIAGILSTDPQSLSAPMLKRMNDAQAHRGPDGEGYYEDHSETIHLGFAHRRLAIIDTSNISAQPFRYGGRYVLVFNGAIYNYRELRSDLQLKGFHFRSTGDTEVLAAAYAAWGPECLHQLDGMFAFAIWDEKEKQLFCARDRFGEKPFFYHYLPGKKELVFASEMKALFAAGIPRQVNNTLLLGYLTLGYTKEATFPEHSFYTNILQLPPAHYLRYRAGDAGPETGRYWDLDKESRRETGIPQAVEVFRDMIGLSVKKRQRSDVPLGTSLSGGIDSTAITALCALSPEAQFTHHAFSAVFPGFEKDESEKIKVSVKQFRLQSFTITPNADNLASTMQALIHHQEEPFGSASVLAQYMVFRMAREKGIKVLLDGQGADETLAGYTKYTPWYLQELIRSRQSGNVKGEIHSLRENDFLAGWGWKNRIAARMPYRTARWLEKRDFGKVQQHPFIHPEFIRANLDREGVVKPVVEKLNDILYFDTMVMGLQELLRYADRNAMAHGVEVRLPFLCHALVQYLFSLPATVKVRSGYTKWILRESMTEIVPASINWARGKTGFEPPQKSWMQDPAVQDNIREARICLVNRGICTKALLNSPIIPAASHDAGNFDFRTWVAAEFLAAPGIPDYGF